MENMHIDIRVERVNYNCQKTLIQRIRLVGEY